MYFNFVTPKLFKWSLTSPTLFSCKSNQDNKKHKFMSSKFFLLIWDNSKKKLKILTTFLNWVYLKTEKKINNWFNFNFLLNFKCRPSWNFFLFVLLELAGNLWNFNWSCDCLEYYYLCSFKTWLLNYKKKLNLNIVPLPTLENDMKK